MAVIHSLWHSFCGLTDYEAEAKNPAERVLLVLRAHPITNTLWLVAGIVLFVLPLAVADYLTTLSLSANQQLFLIVIWYALVFAYLLTKYYFWYFNLGVITNRKIVDVDANNLLNTQTTATTVDKVEEVDKKTLGIIASIFNYGDIFVQTAGEKPNVEFLKVPKPAEVVKIINSNMRINGHRHPR